MIKTFTITLSIVLIVLMIDSMSWFEQEQKKIESINIKHMEDIEKYPKDLSGVMASAYDWIWNSGFNFDITEGISFFLHTNKYEQFEKYFNIHVEILPIPHINISEEKEINYKKIIFTSMGSARKSKGFGIIVEAITKLKNNPI